MLTLLLKTNFNTNGFYKLTFKSFVKVYVRTDKIIKNSN